MASSGSYSSTLNQVTLTLNWSVVSQNASAKTSEVKVDAVLSGPYSVSASSTKSGNITINGSSYNYSFTIGTYSGAWSKTIGSYTVSVPHNSDGTKTVSISGWADPQITYNGKWVGKISVSGSPTLPTINVRSTFSNLPSSVTLGTAFSFSIAKASSSYTHDIVVKLGSSTDTMTNTEVNAGTWTIPTSWANQIPNATSGTATLTLRTYWGGTKVGEQALNVTVNVPSSSEFSPSIASVTATEAGTKVPSAWGLFVQAQSTVRITVSASAGQGATLGTKAIAVSQGGVTKYGAVTDWPVTGYGDHTYSVKVTDSRGKTATGSRVVAVVQWFPPSFSATSLFRSTSGGAAQDDGTYAAFKTTYSAASVNLKNVVTRDVKYRVAGSTGSYTSAGSFNSNTTKTFGGSFSTGTRYEVVATITDSFTTSTWVGELPTAFVTMDFKSGGRGIGLGTVATLENTLEIAFKTRFTGGIDPIRIPSGANLDSYRTAGFYFCPSTADAQNISNTAANIAFALQVLDLGTAGTVQLFYGYDIGANGAMWKRRYYGGWSAWELWNDADYASTKSNASNAINRLDALENSYSVYTPTWYSNTSTLSIGNGTIIGKYKYVGKTCFFLISLTRGSTTNVGGDHYRFSLPVNAAVWNEVNGSGFVARGGTEIPHTIRPIGTGLISVINQNGRVGTSNPGSWATGDAIYVQGHYQIN